MLQLQNGNKMTEKKLIYTLQNPETINALITEQLDAVLNEYPYFQAARAIQLKGFKSAHSFRYNTSLKKTAAYTVDRQILFEFITSPIFLTKNLKEVIELEEIEVVALEEVKIEKGKGLKKKEENLTKLSKNTNEEISDILQLGKPFEFTKSEPHSFSEWLQLTEIKPLEKNENSDKLSTKFRLIDKFIETNPKIKPMDKNAKVPEISLEGTEENKSLMTETLAKVYLEQKKYDNAIKAYHILSLKYPEKSSFFAIQIKAIKNLQNNKS